MADRSKTIRFSLASFGRRSFVLRCILLIGVWQGPVPWCHSHGTLATQNEQAPEWLVEHLKSHHAAVSSQSEVVCGWHVHFDFPTTTDEEPGQPPRPRHDRVLMSSVNSTSELMTRTAMPSVLADIAVDVHQVITALAEHVPAVTATHFHDGFATSLSLPLRFCVSQC